jgi:hypothetical protein
MPESILHPEVKDETPNGSISPQAYSLLPSDVEKHAKLGIPLELLLAARVARVTNSLARTDFGIWAEAAWDCAGIIYPYFVPRVAHRVTCRLRLDKPRMRNGRPVKYLSPYGDARHLYYPPGAKELLLNPDTAVVLVEAEKSALAMLAWARRIGKDNLLPLGMGGCWGWRGNNIRIGIAPNGERIPVGGPLPDLNDCNGRTTYVLLDSNSATNPHVRLARIQLVVELNRPERNCTVKVCDLPWQMK